LKPNKAGYEKKARTDQHGYELWNLFEVKFTRPSCGG
jgi:hypothetical protein